MNRLSLLITASLAVACSDVEDSHDDHHGHDHEHEMITTVRLSFTDSTGAVTEADFYDPMDGTNPTADAIVLALDETYTLDVSFWNEFEDPAEDIPPEINAEAEEHQVFVYGSGVSSAATEDNPDALIEVTYLDTDEAGLDLGLENDVVPVLSGTATLSVLLRHMPTENGESVKTESLASDFIEGGASALPGATDVDVDFDLTVE